MRQKTSSILLGILIGVSFLSGCAKTPEESLVKQKGEASLKNYEEGQELTGTQGEDGKTAAGGTENGSEPDRAENNGTEASANDEQNLLRQSLEAPEHYHSEVKDETGKLQILTDADVEIPNAEKVSAIAVSQHPFDQTVMDRIMDTFFPEARIYTSDNYNQLVKSDYQKKIEELKGYVAEGNLDPFGYGTDENGNYIYDIYQVIEAYEQEMQEAPEEKNLVEVRPQYGLEGDDLPGTSAFYGVACQPDDTAYNYIMKTYGSMAMEIRLEKIRESAMQDSTIRWIEYSVASADPTAGNLPDEEEIKQKIGITLEEAKKTADEKVESLELDHMEMTAWEYGVCYEEQFGQAYGDKNPEDFGYMLHYTRKLNGIPITHTSEWGGNLEDMDSEMETWCYEVLDFVVTKDGIDIVHFNNQYDIGDVRTENLNLLSFDEIMKIYEKMMVIQNADVLNYAVSETYSIDRIVFGYTRIYEPATDSQSGLLVPVWDFFGSDEMVYDNEGQQESFTSAMQYRSYLTINGVDGSIISRSLGY